MKEGSSRVNSETTHELLHTFVSYQAMAGVAGRGLQVLLGHKARG
jgi:hypothetical protein